MILIIISLIFYNFLVFLNYFPFFIYKRYNLELNLHIKRCYINYFGGIWSFNFLIHDQFLLIILNGFDSKIILSNCLQEKILRYARKRS